MAIEDVVVAVAIVTVVDCCCLTACICVVCLPLSNGLVQLVCEDGGIVSLLILPQPRSFMRPVKGASSTRMRREPLAKSSASWTADVDDVVGSPQVAVRPQCRDVEHILRHGELRRKNRRSLIDLVRPPRSRDRDEQRENNGRLRTSGGTHWSRGAQKSQSELVRRFTCRAAEPPVTAPPPPGVRPPVGVACGHTHTHTRDRWTRGAGGRA